MNRIKLFLSLIFIQVFVIIGYTQSKKLPRIAITGIAIESSTFSPALTREDAFHAVTGDDVFKIYPFFSSGSPERKSAQWFPALKGHSLPGGTVTREAYESLVKKTLDLLKKNLPYDGLFLDIHGAMSVVGLDDPEGDLIIRIREVIGKEPVISTCMDLHGNVSWRLAENTDLITCYRMAPHEDAMESKQRAVDNLLDRIENGKGKPAFKAWISVPILLPGEKTSTRIEPAKSLYAKVAPAANQEGVIDAAIWIGYAWADEPRNHAVVMVTGDNKEKVAHAAENLAKYFWKVRKDFKFIAPTASLEVSLNKAINSKKHPFIISDMGDNPTAGGAGDVTWTLTEILKRKEFKSSNGPSLIYASIPGPDLVDKALKAGVGAHVEAYVGAEVDHRYSPPLKLSGTVEAIRKGDKNAGIEVVVKTGNVNVIVTKKRKPYHYEKDFTRLGLNPRKTDIVVVKIGYLVPELYHMRADWIMALTPGGVDQDIEHLNYKRINRPMFPFDKNMKYPDLKAQFVPSSDQIMATKNNKGKVLKLMTYNIRYDNPKDGENQWSKRKEFLRDQIAFFEPDVFGIQEGLYHQLTYLNENLSDYNYVGVGRDDGKTKGEFSALFYKKDRFKVVLQNTFWLSDTPNKISVGWDASMERVCTYALLEDKTSKQQFWVFNTHFDHRGNEARIQSAKLIIKEISKLNNEKLPVILMGDLNSEPESEQIKFLSTVMNDSKSISKENPFGPFGTFNGFHFDQPVSKRIDYIFTSKGNIRVSKFAVLSDSKDLRYPSDHLPVFVEIKID